MKNKFLLTATLVAALTLAAPVVANAAEAEGGSWKSNAKGWWYEYTDGTYVTNDFCEVNGKTYYFKADGYMATGWQQIKDDYGWNQWYYFENSGAMVTGWKQINGKWYYFFEDGVMASSGVITIGDKEHTFAPSGQWVSGWTWDSYTYDNGYTDYGWYDANADGSPYDYNKEDDVLGGWLLSNGTWYYIQDTKMVAGRSIEDKGVTYRFKNDGAMVTGWYQYGNRVSDWLYCNADGSAYDGWLAYNGSWYYISNGDMSTNCWIDSEDTNSDVAYYLGRDGRMVTGWYDCSYSSATGKDTSYMYTNADGSRYSGWVACNGKWYYIRNSEMIADSAIKAVEYKDYKKADGTIDWDAYNKACNAAPTYIFDGTGAMVTGWYQETATRGGQTTYNRWYYADADGKGHDGWLQYKNAWYYIADGVMLINCYTPDGYWVGMDGVWK